MNKGEKSVKKILASFEKKQENLIPVLQSLQREKGYVSPEGILAISKKFGISENRIYGVVSFYSQFNFLKPGRHRIQICLGTACHVKGGEELLGVVKEELGIEPGETTEDGMFSLERVACLGCCALAPTVVIDGNVHGKMTPKQVKELLNEHRGN